MPKSRKAKAAKSFSSSTFKLNAPAFPPIYARQSRATVEPLEPRCLLSVSASTLFGATTVGQVKTYADYQNGTQVDTRTDTVTNISTASFNGYSGLAEIDESVVDIPADNNSDTSTNFTSLGANGLLAYGGTHVTNDGTGSGDSDSTTTFTPPYVYFPPSMSVGTNYPTSFTVNTVSSNGSNSIPYNYIIDLVSNSLQTVTLPSPIGAVSAYEVQRQVSGTSSNITVTIVDTDYYEPNVGLVQSTEVTTSMNANTDKTTSNTSVRQLTGISTVTSQAVKLAFTQTPTTAVTGVVPSTPTTVAVEDIDGNVVTSDTSAVTVELTNPQGATLGGTTTVDVVNGIATFSDLNISQAGGYTFTASDDDLAPAVSPSITVLNPFATFSSGVLTINGTGGDDVITLASDGTNVTATLNGAPSPAFALSTITSINVNGNAGNDSITIQSSMPATLGVSVQGGPGDDTIQGGPGNDTLGGGQGNDFILGGPGDDLIHGGAGDDSLGGGQGNDILYGGPGNDTMTGGAGNDVLIGGAGNNVLHGGLGDDTLFAINGAADTLYGGAGNDTAHIDQGLDQIPNNDIETVLFV